MVSERAGPLWNLPLQDERRLSPSAHILILIILIALARLARILNPLAITALSSLLVACGGSITARSITLLLLIHFITLLFSLVIGHGFYSFTS
jgi:hypothetical protein